MSDTAPLTPMKRSLLVLLSLLIILVAFGSVYIKAANPRPPHWVDLSAPLVTATIGLLWWTYPAIVRTAPVWRRGVAIFLFALAALELILFFVSKGA